MSDEFDLTGNANATADETDVTGFDLDGFDEVPDNPNYIADGKYAAILAKVTPRKAKEGGGNKKVVFTYKIDDEESAFNKKSIDVWRDVISKPGPDASAEDINNWMTKMSWLKRDCKTLGLTGSYSGGIAAISINDILQLVGTEVYITIKNNGQYTNVNKIELRDVAFVPGGSNASVDF